MANKNKKSKKNELNHKSKNVENTDPEVEDQEPENDEQNYSTVKLEEPDINSDEDEPPKKKKKKKLSGVAATSEKKGKKSIRQMKKEKHAQRQAEAAAVAKDQLKSQCISYLSQWKHDRVNWKFMKAKQVWLYKNKFSANLVPDSSWPTFLEYFESAKGNIRNMLLEDAKKVINQMDQWTEDNQKDNEVAADGENFANKPDDTSYKRARDLIQCLEE